MDEQQPQNMPIPPVSVSERSLLKKTFTPKFIIAIAIFLVIGGSVYGYTSYLAWNNYEEVVRQAKLGQEEMQKLEEKRLNELGIILPPDPGEIGKLSIEGIDSDGDGIRDDIQRYIYLTYYDSKDNLSALEQYIKIQQLFVRDADDKELTRNHSLQRHRALDCMSYIFGLGKAHAISDDLKVEFLNTPMRSGAYIKADGHLSGTTTTLTPIGDERKGCDFDPDQINDTSTWKTYRNEEYGFEFKYPGDWESQDISVDYGDGRIVPGFNVTAPIKKDLAGYEGIAVQYMLQAVWLNGRLTTDFPNGTPRGGFRIPDKESGQEPFYANLNNDIMDNSYEYKTGQQILSTFRLTENYIVMVKEGNVYLNDQIIGQQLILESENPTAPNTTKNISEVITYKTAILSPDKKFVLMNGNGWEVEQVIVFDIKTGISYTVNTNTGHDSGEWLPDGKLRVVANKGMTNESCGIFESVDNIKPWIVKRISNC